MPQSPRKAVPPFAGHAASWTSVRKRTRLTMRGLVHAQYWIKDGVIEASMRQGRVGSLGMEYGGLGQDLRYWRANARLGAKF